ncbi:39S ribosomal protein L53, mitochondrial isoform X2 [Tupaia chinensis]|uniref:39S ribosomal protein L53, mitochondrial isoform X2 n=1 Tax=Tupaia chinensis TaxID=246437 RepID=UPI000FFB2F76|nr:39S ribosomal protein L53, mitochondrial isoform X2 [Tupaia chinensis]
MAAALARLGLRSVKQVRVQFCPFEKNVESTRTFLQAVSSEKETAIACCCAAPTSPLWKCSPPSPPTSRPGARRGAADREEETNQSTLD